MKKNYSICVTTFREREEICCNQIRSIAKYSPGKDIIVIINGNNEMDMDNGYRSRMLSFCSQIPDCYVIMCPEFKSLAKMWNTCVIFSKNDYNFILNDDVSITGGEGFNMVAKAIDQTGLELFTVNRGWSHFVITKQMLHNLGYFDERLIAFGEEDGDLIHRFIKKFNKEVPTLMVPDIMNFRAYDKTSPNLEIHIDNKPRFNREFVNLKYKLDTEKGIYGASPVPVSQVIDDIPQYPYEMFNIHNKHNIKSFSEIKFIYE